MNPAIASITVKIAGQLYPLPGVLVRQGDKWRVREIPAAFLFYTGERPRVSFPPVDLYVSDPVGFNYQHGLANGDDYYETSPFPSSQIESIESWLRTHIQHYHRTLSMEISAIPLVPKLPWLDSSSTLPASGPSSDGPR